MNHDPSGAAVFWRQSVLANPVGELVGLGLVGVAGDPAVRAVSGAIDGAFLVRPPALGTVFPDVSRSIRVWTRLSSAP